MIEYILAAIAGKAIYNQGKKIRDKREENRRRRNTPCSFDDGISFDDFEDIAYEAARKFKRITGIKVDGPVIYCDVRSQSGLSTWEFHVDFNDWGHITGAYWWGQDNKDSDIPEYYGDMVQELIHKHEEAVEEDEDEPEEIMYKYCSRCGARASAGAKYCHNCGSYIW